MPQCNSHLQFANEVEAEATLVYITWRADRAAIYLTCSLQIDLIFDEIAIIDIQ